MTLQELNNLFEASSDASACSCVATVEEAVRGAVVRDELVLDARLGKRPVERGDVVGRNALVGAADQAENRRRISEHGRAGQR